MKGTSHLGAGSRLGAVNVMLYRCGDVVLIVDVEIALEDVADVLCIATMHVSAPRGHGAVRTYTGTRNKKK